MGICLLDYMVLHQRPQFHKSPCFKTGTLRFQLLYSSITQYTLELIRRETKSESKITAVNHKPNPLYVKSFRCVAFTGVKYDTHVPSKQVWTNQNKKTQLIKLCWPLSCPNTCVLRHYN